MSIAKLHINTKKTALFLKKICDTGSFHLFQVVFLHHLTTIQNGSTSVRRGLKLSFTATVRALKSMVTVRALIQLG